MIVSTLILVFSLGSLAQFSTAYCRTLLIAYGKVEISERAREITGIDPLAVAPEEFARLMCLVNLAPDPEDDSTEIRIVLAYFRVMRLARTVLAPISQGISRWIDCELSKCSYFAVVTLDRRLPPLSQI